METDRTHEFFDDPVSDTFNQAGILCKCQEFALGWRGEEFVSAVVTRSFKNNFLNHGQWHTSKKNTDRCLAWVSLGMTESHDRKSESWLCC